MTAKQWKKMAVDLAVRSFRLHDLHNLDLHGDGILRLLRHGFRGLESYSETELHEKLQAWYKETTSTLETCGQGGMTADDFRELSQLAEDLEQSAVNWDIHGEHEVVVGNLGKVYRGMDGVQAQAAYAKYASGDESVVWLQEDTVREKYEPVLRSPEDQQELDQLKTDFREWSGGFKPFDENHITVYLDYALSDQDDRDRVSEWLMDWYNSEED